MLIVGHGDRIEVAIRRQRGAGRTERAGCDTDADRRGGGRAVVRFVAVVGHTTGRGKGGADHIGQVAAGAVDQRGAEGGIGDRQAQAVIGAPAQIGNRHPIVAIQIRACQFIVADDVERIFGGPHEQPAHIGTQVGEQRQRASTVGIGPNERAPGSCRLDPIEFLGVGIERQVTDGYARGRGVDDLAVVAVKVAAEDKFLTLPGVTGDPKQFAPNRVNDQPALIHHIGDEGPHVAAVGVGTLDHGQIEGADLRPIDTAGAFVYGQMQATTRAQRHRVGVG